MALAELGETVSRAIQQMLNATTIDEEVLKEFLNKIWCALFRSDVPLFHLNEIRANMMEILNLKGDRDRFRITQLVIFNELCRILYAGNPSFTPTKGKASVIVFIGEESEKTICTKYANYHLKKGWKPALVCANTSRACAFDQPEQNASNAKIPFYESYTESDPVRIAVEGVERFKKENCDLIIVDAIGCFKEVHEVATVTKADLVIFVLDSSIGQAAAFDQARAFKQCVSDGAVIITKIDGHAKGFGALSAVAAAQSPIIFIGTGGLIDEFRVFDVRRFVGRILGMGDCFRYMDKIHEVPMDQQPDLQQNLFERNLTLRTMYERFQKKLKRGSIGQAISMLPASCIERMPKDLEKVIEAKVKSYVTMMDFMTDEELDNSNPMLMTETQIMRIAHASGQLVEDVIDMLEEYKRTDKTRRTRKGLMIRMKAEMSAERQKRLELECLTKQMGSVASAKEI